MNKSTTTAWFAKLGVAALVLASAGCVAVVPMGNDDNNKTDNGSGASGTQPQATVCNIEGQDKQDLSNGTTKVLITQSCEKTEIYIENQHPEHPKKCQVRIGAQATQLYIQPGESRTLTQQGPVEKAQIYVNCVNDWNRTK
ncbi:hypothetical protein [Limnobacter sp.]|uniref:hypothetical protein n=1 Tax=Limnobacter sp. TaxID=2003368 RepID=UPI0025856E54|nr:hypothetical protein [Limnobacter sp.]